MNIQNTFKSAFMFQGYKCITDFDDVVDKISGEKLRSIVIKNDKSQKYDAAYFYGDGLKEIKTNGNEKNNILGEFLGIQKNDTTQIMSFFNKYGFIFNLDGYENYISISIDDIMYVKENLEALINLLSAQNTTNVNYKKLLDSVLFLLLRENREIKIEDTIIYKYTNNFLHNIKNATVSNLSEFENIVHSHRDDGNIDIAYRFKDLLSDTGYSDIIQSNYNQLMQTDDFDYYIPKQIFKTFAIKDSIFNEDDCLSITFLFHFIQEISTFYLDQLELDMAFSENVYDDLKSSENKYLLDALFKISKHLIERELNFNLSEVRPTYDAKTMQPNWNIKSLLSAMYMSLFYLDSKQGSYRSCKNINCGEFFLVSKTNSKKQYCCICCTNAVSTRKSRQKNRSS